MDFNKMTKKELIEYINNLNENNNGKYGLIWDKEKEPEQIVTDCDKYIPVLKEIKEKKINNKGKEHILIEGDNFHSLSVLNYTHKEKIDIIYIDPPYNTGHEDFCYNDNFVEKEDGYKHSKWLNFMTKRLNLAKELLKKDGLIFISIDDNELYQLKLLCDKIFFESNFIANIVVETANGVFGTRASQTTKTIVKVKDYILVYAKNKNEIKRDFQPLYMPTNDLFDPHYSIMLDKKYNRLNLINYFKNSKKISSKFKKYNIAITINNISKLMRVDKEFNDYIIKISDKIYQDVSYSLNIPEAIDKKLKKGKVVKYKDNIIFRTKNGHGTPRQYVSFKNSLRLTDSYTPEYRKSVAIGDLWEGFDADMKNVSKEGDCEFKNGKKPVRLIKQLIKWANVKNGIILDFFAGSGTTAQAVVELNKEDGGNRQFILCTNNEISQSDELDYQNKHHLTKEQYLNQKYKTKTWQDFAEKKGICTSITYPRLKKVLTANHDLNYSLEYFKTEFVENSNNRDQLYFDLTEKCIPMLCVKENCYNIHKLTNEYAIYYNQNKNKYTCVYFDLFGDKEEEFINELLAITAKKCLYIFSLSEYVDETKLSPINNYKIETIPYKIIELYRKLVTLSKGE